MNEIIQNISIIIVSLTAIYGIISWRREHLGKRKIDLAEEVLCSIYEIKDVIKYIRNPISFPDVSSTRKRAEYETEKQSKFLDNAYVVFERYNKHKNVFSNFYKLKYRYMANFGKNSEEPFVIIGKASNNIFFAARMLGQVYWKDQDGRGMSDKEFENHRKKLEKFERIFWEENDKDDINRKVDEAISICESICKSSNSFGLKNYFKNYKGIT